MQTDVALGRRGLPPFAPLRHASDQALVEQARAGSDRAFEALFDRHRRSLMAYCARMLDSIEEAEDAVQLTFIAAYSDLTRAEPPRAWRPWLYGIARHRCLSALRARRERAVETVSEAALDGVGAELATREELRTVLADMARLPDDQRVALVLAEFADLPHTEIAEVLGCRREKVKALVFQARTSLAAHRAARDTPCAEIREQLATVRGGALRRAALRRHLSVCPACEAFAEELRSQRRLARVLVPATPAVGLRHGILGAIFGSGGAAGESAILSGALGTSGLVAVALAAGAVHHGGQRGAPTPSPPDSNVAFVAGAPAAAAASYDAMLTAFRDQAYAVHAGARRHHDQGLGESAPTDAPQTPGRPADAAPSATAPEAASATSPSDDAGDGHPQSGAHADVGDAAGGTPAGSAPMANAQVTPPAAAGDEAPPATHGPAAPPSGQDGAGPRQPHDRAPVTKPEAAPPQAGTPPEQSRPDVPAPPAANTQPSPSKPDGHSVPSVSPQPDPQRPPPDPSGRPAPSGPSAQPPGEPPHPGH